MVLGPWSLAVIQTVSQNRAFDLFTDSARILIRLKVRTEVVPQKASNSAPGHHFPSFEVRGPWFNILIFKHLFLKERNACIIYLFNAYFGPIARVLSDDFQL